MCSALFSRYCSPRNSKIGSTDTGAAEWGDILRDLDRLQEIDLEQDGKRFVLRTPTTGVAGRLFQAVGVALPPNLQEIPLPKPQPTA